jgi:saccharopine dehydrogenase-like NADP-dependent oxidoreductase
MSRTVGFPAAIGTRLILEGKLASPGVHVPTTQEIYNPVLDELEAFDIVFKEKTTPL